ncbi:MAG TPA: hypothetical protein ENI19_01145 [Candidatus Nealsonbacteria bacterium]|uniref:Uncharacterized protein n=1 Tax=marine sediment metagenome TaxID=412755 RepID=A0A0F9XT85_9ZZZZ|nr:hypothetical protein [Candidatus Nealsonbacteria bacterium]HEB46299.1 hypothetical protein [Candidatus Nealsonbacteria bacterium]
MKGSEVVGKCPHCGGDIIDRKKLVGIVAILMQSPTPELAVEKITENEKPYFCGDCSEEFDTVPS